MENSSNTDENYDLGYQPSPSSTEKNYQSTTETPVCSSTMSCDSFLYCRTYSEASVFSEPVDDHSCFSEASPSHYWLAKRSGVVQRQAVLSRLATKRCKSNVDEKLDDLDTLDSATVLGQNLRLEPLNHEKKALWKREMDCILSVCDYIVEFSPTKSQNLSTGIPVEEILDSFQDREFWYMEQWSMSANSTRTETTRNGGCRCRVFLQPVSRRKQGSTGDTNETVLIKFSRQLCLSTAVFFPRWKFLTHTRHPFQRVEELVSETRYTATCTQQKNSPLNICSIVST